MPLALKKLVEKKANALQTLAKKKTSAQPTPAAGPGFFGANAPAKAKPAQQPVLPDTSLRAATGKEKAPLSLKGLGESFASGIAETLKIPELAERVLTAGKEAKYVYPSEKPKAGDFTRTPENTAEKISKGIGTAVGIGAATVPAYGIPGVGALGALAGRGAAGAVGKVLPKAAGLAGRAATAGTVGTVAGAAYGTAEGIIEGKSPADIAKTAGKEALLFGATDAVFPVLSVAGKALWQKTAPKVRDGLLKRFTEKQVAAKVEQAAAKGEGHIVNEQGKVVKETPKPEPQPQLKEVLPEADLLAPSAKKPRSFPGTVAKGDLTGPELKKLIKENPQLYQPITNKETLSTAQRIIDENPDAAKAIVLEGKSFDNATEAAMAQDLVRRLQSEGKWDEAFAVMAKASEKFTQAGQTVQAASMWRRMTPEGMLKYANKVIEQANQQIKKGKKIKLTNDLQKKIADDMKVIEGMQDGVAKDLAIAQVLDSIEAQIPISLWRKISTIQAMSHLLNVRTAMRNLFGNLSFAVEETLSNTLAIPVDRVIARWTGKKTVSLPGIKEPLKAGLARARQSAKEVKSGLHTEPGKYEIARGRTFRKGPLSALEKALGYELRVPDEAFKGFREQQALDQMLKMSGLKEPTQEMLEQAAHEARYSTFQDESLPAQILQSIKDAANKVGGGKDIPGAQIRSTKEFGVGDLIIKYTRVPGNIISRSIEYTPVGALRAISLMAQAQKSGVLNQREIALTLGRAMTGTGMIAMGAWLHNKGILVSQDKDADRDASALQRAAGLTGYKLNMSAIARAINGFSTELQAGDNLYSINWLAPVAVAFVIGATIDAQLKKDGTPVETATAIGSNSIDEILDLPTMFIINAMFYESLRSDANAFTIASVPFAEAVPGFIPGPVRQLAQTLDPVARDTRGGSVLESAKLKVQGNIPGVRESLQPRISPTGQEIKYPGGLFSNMVSPATKSVYMPTAYTDELKALEEATGETKMYPPGSAPKSFVWRKERIELTPEERTGYQKVAGQRIDKRFGSIFSNVDVERLNDSQRKALVERLAKVIGESREYAKFQILRSRLQSTVGE